MLDGRKRIVSVIAALSITTLSGSVLLPTASYAEPNIKDVQARVDRLYHEAEQASERYNNAKEELQRTQVQLKALRADLARQQKKFDAVRSQVASSVLSQYQGQALSTTSRVFLSKDPDTFLDQLTVVSAYDDQQAEMLSEFATQQKQLELREAAAKRELAQIAATKAELGKEKAAIDAKSSEAKQLLGQLKADARSAVVSRSADRPKLPNVAVSGDAGAAISYAEAQVGDAYVYGASGPDAFDCSGLTMMAWKQAGVSLPHSASAQSQMGTPVSSSDLQPGDLVFYYSPVSHVGIYVGNGKVVHAANPSDGVEVSDVFSMPFNGARRF